MTSSDRFQQYAGLLCDVGLSLEPGQDVAVNAQIEHAELARADDGVITDATGGHGKNTILAQLAADEGARRLGEIALVDDTSPIGRSGTVFRETLLDENATCHIAWGAGIPSVLPGWRSLSDDQLRTAGINQSATHVDFMIGGPEVSVTGLHASGTRIPILRAGTWQPTTAPAL